MLAFDKDIPLLGLCRCILHCNAPLLTISQFIGMRRRANLIYQLIPVFRLIMRSGSGAVSCVGIGFISDLLRFRDRRSGTEGVAWFGPIGLQDLGRHFRHVVGHPQRTESGDRICRVEIPVVVRESDEIPDRGVASPGAAKCGAGEFRGYPCAKKTADVGLCRDRLDWWQARRIERETCSGRRRAMRAVAGCMIVFGKGIHGWRRAICSFGFPQHLALATRPARQKVLTIAHQPLPFSVGRASAKLYGSARSRSRLKNGCSTWCSTTNASTISRTAAGIGTAPTRSSPACVNDSPSAGSAVTATTRKGGSPPVVRNATHSDGAPDARLSRYWPVSVRCSMRSAAPA